MTEPLEHVLPAEWDALDGASSGRTPEPQLCRAGNHAWLPWLAVQHPDYGTIRFYWTKCVRCGTQGRRNQP